MTANLSAPEARSGQSPAGAASAGDWRRRRGKLFVAAAAAAAAAAVTEAREVALAAVEGMSRGSDRRETRREASRWRSAGTIACGRGCDQDVSASEDSTSEKFGDSRTFSTVAVSRSVSTGVEGSGRGAMRGVCGGSREMMS